MATLTQIAHYTRKGISFGLIGLVALFVLKNLTLFGIKQWQKSRPAPTPAPNVLFGKLPRIEFPPSSYPYPQSFTLETIDGKLSEASTSANVYQIPKKLPSLLASRRAQEFANRLGFFNQPILKTPTEYKFEHPKTPLKTLDLDIVNYNFSYQYDFLKDPEVFTEGPPSQPELAAKEAEIFFQSTGIFPQDLQQGQKKTLLLKFSEKGFAPATSLSKADAIKVNFLRSDLENFPVLPPDINQAPVFAILTGSSEKEKRIIQAEFNYFEIDNQTTATYPIKTAAQAWEELQKGMGFISSFQKSASRAVVRKNYLAYYDSGEYQPFLQPIFVFEGDQDFVAYVPAITDEWLE